MLRVRGHGRDLARVVDRLFGVYASAAPAAPTITCEIERADALPDRPAGAPRFRFPPLSAFAAGNGWRLCDEVSVLEVAPAEGRIRGVLGASAPIEKVSMFGGLTLWVALIECLRAVGRYPLHAAALVDPAGETLLLCGTKAAGKSTLTLTLLEAGFAVLSDDMVFLERAADGAPGVIGYAKRFHVRPDLLLRRPDLAPLARDPEPFEPQDKKWLALEERFADRLGRRARAPTRLFFPEIVDAPGSQRAALGPREALLALLEHSSFVFVRPELAPAHLDLLRAVCDGARAARLRCGRDLLADPRRVLDLLEGTWASTVSAWS